MDEKEQKQLLMDLDVVMRSSDCPYIVQFYGALFREVSLKYCSVFSYLALVLLYISSITQVGVGWFGRRHEKQYNTRGC